MNEGVMNLLLDGVLGIAVILITGVLVPYLKQKYGYEKFEKAYHWAVIAVNAAEQIFNATGMGAQKYEYVANFLNAKGFKLTEEEVKVMIESIVKEINDAALAEPVAKDIYATMEEILVEMKAPTV
jgi:uncharacterized protein (UPF0333 family)